MPNNTSHRLAVADTISDVLMILLYVLFMTLETDVSGIYTMIGLIAAIFLINIIRRPNLNLHIGRGHLYMILFAFLQIKAIEQRKCQIFK